MKLVENWCHAHKFISNRCVAIVIGCNGAYRFLDPGLQAAIPSWIVTTLSVALLVIGMFGTVIDQTGDSRVSDPTRETDHV